MGGLVRFSYESFGGNYLTGTMTEFSDWINHRALVDLHLSVANLLGRNFTI